MDCESKNKKSLQLFQTEKASNEVNQALSLVSPLPDAVHVAKLDRASFANWFRFVDRYRVNLVLLRTCRLDPIMKDQLTPKLSTATCRNRDRMNVDTMVEICSEDVCTVVSAAKSLTQTLIPEVYRLYDGNKPGTLGAPVSICSGTWEMFLIADKEKGKIFTARLHYPVDVGVCLSGLDIPISITYVEGLLFIIESGQHRIACFDFTGKNLLNPDRMTVKQLQDALKA